MFYRIDSRRVTFREYRGSGNLASAVLDWVVARLGIRVPSSVDDANVESLEEFEIAPRQLPRAVWKKFEPLLREAAACGFRGAVYRALEDAFHRTKIYEADFNHPSGYAVARIHYRVWNLMSVVKESLFPMLISAFDDGTFLVSTAGKPDLAGPPSCRVNRVVGASLDDLWASHLEALQAESEGKRLVRVDSERAMRRIVTAYHAAVRDFHLERGVFAPMTEQELERARRRAETAAATSVAGGENAEVLAEIERLRNRKASWWNTILILAVSVGAFFAIGAGAWPREMLLLLVPILFFHELGHLLAMRVFGYRNLRMFFIPLFGAAVTGRHYNVPGWKKAIVSLMGPVPGILGGIVLGIVGMVVQKPMVVQAAVLALALNGFNLLPVLPLDGGWVMQSILFCRHYLLDTGFRAVAAVLVLVGSAVTKDRVLMAVGIFLLLGLHMAYRMGKIASRLRERGVASGAAGDDKIPAETAQAIIEEVKTVYPRGRTIKGTAQLTLSVYEMINARPPGLAATVALAGVHGASLCFAIVFGVVFAIGQHANLGEFARAAATRPTNTFECGTVLSVEEKPAPGSVDSAPTTIVATFPSRAKAEERFHQLSGQLAAGAGVKVFGQSVLVTVPAGDDGLRQKYVSELDQVCKDVFVAAAGGGGVMRMVCLAKTTEEAEAIEAELNSYFNVPWNTYLSAPWSPEHKLTEAERKGRRTYHRLQHVRDDTVDPRMTAAQKEFGEAMRRGDKQATAKLMKEMGELGKEQAKARLDRVRGEGEVDLELIDVYAGQPQMEPGADEANRKAFTAEYQQWWQRLGARMGQLKLADGKPAPGEDRYSARSGYVTHTALVLQLEWVSFERVGEGAPALAKWLCDKGCVDFKYGFSGRPGFGDEGEDPLEE